MGLLTLTEAEKCAVFDYTALVPGDILVSDFSFGPIDYQHWSLVSDRRCEQGIYMLISATERTGTVCEEPAHEVIQCANTYKALHKSLWPIPKSIELARSHIGKWDYSVTERNCQHFINLVTGLGLRSSQVYAGITSGLIGGVGTALLKKDASWFEILSVTVASIASGVVASKALQHNRKG